MSQSDWVHIRSPFVYWAQTEAAVSLRVEIRNAQVRSGSAIMSQITSDRVLIAHVVTAFVQSPRIQIDENKVTFDSTGEGAFGESEYHFEIIFAHEVNPKVGFFVLD